jgi:hypothetical protein
MNVTFQLINSISNKKELPDQWKESSTVRIHKNGEKKVTVIIIMGYHCYQLHTKCCPISFSQGEVHI